MIYKEREKAREDLKILSLLLTHRYFLIRKFINLALCKFLFKKGNKFTQIITTFHSKLITSFKKTRILFIVPISKYTVLSGGSKYTQKEMLNPMHNTCQFSSSSLMYFYNFI